LRFYLVENNKYFYLLKRTNLDEQFSGISLLAHLVLASGIEKNVVL
jgi:hypothetical protein